MANRGQIVVKKGTVVKGNNFVDATPKKKPVAAGVPSVKNPVLSSDVRGNQTVKSPQTQAFESSASSSTAAGVGTGSSTPLIPSSVRTPAAPNSVSPVSESQKFAQSAPGQFVTGFMQPQAIDSNGRDIRTMSSSQQLGFAVGQVGNIMAVEGASRLLSGAIQKVNTGNTVSKTLNIGKVSAPTAKSTAEAIAVNTKNADMTKLWLGKMAKGAVNPTFVAGAVMGAIGTYPFAGFIKEEALQTLSFSTKTAIDNGDLEGAQAAIDMQREILNPDMWDNIVGAVPFANVVANLKDFYQAAKLKTDIDQKVVNDLKNQTSTGETDSEFYARIESERVAKKEAERKADEEYYAQVERNRAAAKAAERKADEKYWADIAAKKSSSQKKKDDFDADYWSAYYKALAKAKDNSAPSNLKFGLL